MWCGMERGVAVAAFREDRHEQLAGDEDEERRDEPSVGNPEPRDPQQLHDGDAPRVPERGASAVRVPRRGAQPQADHREPHDGVADDDGEGLAVVEEVRDARGEEEGAGHDDEGQHPEADVVVVVGRREPRVVHPRPPDGEPGERVPEQRPVVGRGEPVVQLRGVARDGHDEDEVEEELEGGGRAAVLVRVTGGDRATQWHGDEAHLPEYAVGRPPPRGTPATRVPPGVRGRRAAVPDRSLARVTDE